MNCACHTRHTWKHFGPPLQDTGGLFVCSWSDPAHCLSGVGACPYGFRTFLIEPRGEILHCVGKQTRLNTSAYKPPSLLCKALLISRAKEMRRDLMAKIQRIFESAICASFRPPALRRRRATTLVSGRSTTRARSRCVKRRTWSPIVSSGLARPCWPTSLARVAFGHPRMLGGAIAATDASFVCVGTPSAPGTDRSASITWRRCADIGEGIAARTASIPL